MLIHKLRHFFCLTLLGRLNVRIAFTGLHQRIFKVWRFTLPLRCARSTTTSTICATGAISSACTTSSAATLRSADTGILHHVDGFIETLGFFAIEEVVLF